MDLTTQFRPDKLRRPPHKIENRALAEVAINNGREAALYLRVSTDGQSTENQLLQLQRVAELSTWERVGIYESFAVNWAKD
jgi:hypothetical protein